MKTLKMHAGGQSFSSKLWYRSEFCNSCTVTPTRSFSGSCLAATFAIQCCYAATCARATLSTLNMPVRNHVWFTAVIILCLVASAAATRTLASKGGPSRDPGGGGSSKRAEREGGGRAPYRKSAAMDVLCGKGMSGKVADCAGD